MNKNTLIEVGSSLQLLNIKQHWKRRQVKEHV